MEQDKVLGAQQAFKSVMNAFAHPFKIHCLWESGVYSDESAAVTLLAFTLTDNAVSLYVHGDDALTAGIREITYVRQAEAERADFVILRGDGDGGAEILSRVKRGDLIDPQKGATVIVCVRELEGKARIAAEGPGIKGETVFGASECVAEYLRAASKLGVEYPMGFELLFITPRGELIAVPRRIRYNFAEVS